MELHVWTELNQCMNTLRNKFDELTVSKAEKIYGRDDRMIKEKTKQDTASILAGFEQILKQIDQLQELK